MPRQVLGDIADMRTGRGHGPAIGVGSRGFAAWAALLAVCLVGLAPAARAQMGSDRFSEIVVNAATGQVLSSMDAEAPRHPASLAKLMTLYMLFEALRDHRVTLDDPMPVSEHAASMEPVKLYLPPGTTLTVRQAMLGMVTLSANDAAAVLGEYLGGTEDRFAQMMTLRAHSLGMRDTIFRNASGLPDPEQWTTARDMATLARPPDPRLPGLLSLFLDTALRVPRPRDPEPRHRAARLSGC